MKIGNIPQVVHGGVLGDVPDRLSFAADIGRVEAARAALGPDLNLMVDANTSLSTRMAMRYAEALLAFNIRWFEEPTEPENIEGCAALSRYSRIPIAGFETETGKFQFARLIDAGAIQVVQFDVVQVGGLTEARKIAAYAQMHHLPVTAKNYSTAVTPGDAAAPLCAAERRLFECDQTRTAARRAGAVAGHRLRMV
jgi:D-arabinonate dehydratase/D-galactarolactone cycloisomerase